MARSLMGGGPAPDVPLRVLMLSHYFEARRGGIELVAAALARELGARGLSVAWLAHGDTQAASNEPGVTRISLPASDAVEKLLGIPYPVLSLAAWRAVISAARGCDVIMSHDALYMTSIAAALAARVHRKPLVMVQHVGVIPYRGFALRALMAMANRVVAAPLLRSADRVVFISQLTERYFSRVRWRNTPALVFNGLDTTIFFAARSSADIVSARKTLGLPVEMPVALFVGRYVERKGLAALEHVARARQDVLFAFAGRGPLNPSEWSLANTRSYSGLSGAALATLYRASDVLLLPSVGEGFPLVIQEALASGLPVICGADTAQADAQATSLICGIEVDPHDPAGTAQRLSGEMSRVLAQGSSAEAKRARQDFATRRYAWATTATAYEEILREACGQAVGR